VALVTDRVPRQRSGIALGLKNLGPLFFLWKAEAERVRRLTSSAPPALQRCGPEVLVLYQKRSGPRFYWNPKLVSPERFRYSTKTYQDLCPPTARHSPSCRPTGRWEGGSAFSCADSSADDTPLAEKLPPKSRSLLAMCTPSPCTPPQPMSVVMSSRQGQAHFQSGLRFGNVRDRISM
jgi:hypothetical protein